LTVSFVYLSPSRVFAQKFGALSRASCPASVEAIPAPEIEESKALRENKCIPGFYLISPLAALFRTWTSD
jgi:hypothetical protein